MPLSQPSRHHPREVSADLSHWSEVHDARSASRPSPMEAAALADLVNWVADIAVKVTRHTTPDDHDAIERVRRHALAWLADEPRPAYAMQDLLTTTAAVVAAIDRNLLAEDPMPTESGSPIVISVWIA